MEATAQPLVGCMAALDELQGCKYKSSLDIKAGFHNIVVREELKQFCGIVTQDGLFRSEVMMFG